MRLCENCFEEVARAVYGDFSEDADDVDLPQVRRVEESDCEFWAHDKLNQIVVYTKVDEVP